MHARGKVASPRRCRRGTRLPIRRKCIYMHAERAESTRQTLMRIYRYMYIFIVWVVANDDDKGNPRNETHGWRVAPRCDISARAVAVSHWFSKGRVRRCFCVFEDGFCTLFQVLLRGLQTRDGKNDGEIYFLIYYIVWIFENVAFVFNNVFCK